ncbi:GMP synthase [Caprobacter fermentans]|uniref:GMP synthase [glutamine-hydrolyzing] n=1 Tax=Caproicibacter fermentans TaxID=2576756 RepID=A0A6N8I1W9_9FIRM|nr:glutamine-hydrolyzing GMP synthase [Caproicibacter fermentans]MVB11959.1 GMP synthase [Caproicibacter fermentans]OCM99814.1 glutamine-hydrolyzing GMP synthase [Clostridium sp. W14A]QNK41190.1 glutamine-hydrolyzing GMP synthase [Caproicibacter fermentans]
MKQNEAVLILDFGGQYSQLIARRIRDLNVYCEIKSYQTSADEIASSGYHGIIFSGGPDTVYDDQAPKCDKKIFDLEIPILGICYGAQLMAFSLGGEVDSAAIREYGKTEFQITAESPLFQGIDRRSVCWMSHTVYIKTPPAGFQITAVSSTCPVVSMQNTEKKLYATQFHPEVEHTLHGQEILHNFLYEICRCTGDWKMDSFIQTSVEQMKKTIGEKRVICALSGGVDSSVAAALVHRAVGKQLTCIFVDHGLLRKGEAEEVERVFRSQFDMNLVRVDAQARFLARLSGVTEPEQKRKIIGEEFIRVFEEEAKKIGQVDFLCQGTIYPDVVESGTGNSAVIKSHHNVGGLPKDIGFTGLVEPLRYLFKDEVRRVGAELGLPDTLVWRQPFPGPGLAIRIMGEVTADKLSILKDADAVFRDEIAKAGLDRKINQYFAVLTGIKSVGVMGDGRTYDNTIALRGVTTSDFMTADWARIPYDVLEQASSRIINEVKNVNRIVYDITSKPPATIEWE